MKDSHTEEAVEQPSAAELREQQPHARRIFLDRSSPPTRSIVRVVMITLLILLSVWLVGQILTSLTYLLFLVVLSIFFAYLMDPLVKLVRQPFKARKIERFMPRSLAIVVSYLIVFLVLVIAISGIAPRVSEQAKGFGANLPAYGTSIREKFGEFERRYARLRLPEDLQARVSERLTTFGEEATATAGNFLLALVSYLPWFILVPIISFFFLKDVNPFRLSLLRMFPAGPLRIRADSILNDINLTLAAYTRAQLISCLIIGVICAIALYLIGLQYSLLFGLLAAVCEFVPLIGPLTFGILVTVLASFSDNPWRGLYVAIFLVVLRITQDYFLYPRIVRGGIHLHPLAIILSVLAGEQLAGIPGVFLAIPIVAILTVLYKHAAEHTGSPSLISGWLEPEEVPSEEVA